MGDAGKASLISSVKTSIEIAAIMIGGCWVFFRYMSHEREGAKLALEQQRLATAQASAVAKTQIAAESARLEQVRLSNSQATLAVEFQTKTQSMAIEQQRLATEQGRLVLAVAESQRKLRDQELRQSVKLQEQEITLKKLQALKTAHEVELQGKYRFGRAFKLDGKRLREISDKIGEYELIHGFQFENKSETAFEVSLFVIDYYIGTPKRGGDNDDSIMPIGSPADRWNPASMQAGALEWKHVGHAGSVYAEAASSIKAPWNDIADVKHLTCGGGGTAKLQPTQSLHYDDTYLVRAPRHAYVAFVVSYCFNRCATNEDLYSRVDTIDVDKLDNNRAYMAVK
jgi:hypothetical protein